MREFRTYGSVRGALGNGRSYRDHLLLVSETEPGAGRGSHLELRPRPPFGGTEIAHDPGT